MSLTIMSLAIFIIGFGTCPLFPLNYHLTLPHQSSILPYHYTPHNPTPLCGPLMSHGNFTVSTMYKILANFSPPIANFQWIWHLHIPPKIKFFLWLCCHNRLPTTTYLHRLGITQFPTCFLCHQSEETIFHILLHCPHAQSFWKYLGRVTPLATFTINTDAPCSWLKHLLTTNLHATPYAINFTTLASFVIWPLWLTRNNNLFNHLASATDVNTVIHRALNTSF